MRQGFLGPGLHPAAPHRDGIKNQYVAKETRGVEDQLLNNYCTQYYIILDEFLECLEDFIKQEEDETLDD